MKNNYHLGEVNAYNKIYIPSYKFLALCDDSSPALLLI